MSGSEGAGSRQRGPATRHLSMRVHHVEQVMHGLYALKPPPLAPLDQAQIDVERLRHLLWNGDHERACEALGRIASWAKDAIVLNDPAMEARARRLVARCTELQAYIENNEGALIDYGQRYRACSATITVSAGASIRMSASGGFSIRLLWRIVNGKVGVQSFPKPRGGSTACRSARSMSQMACNASAVVVSRRLSGSVSNQAA